MKNKLVVILGFPGTGKQKIVRYLSKEHSLKHIRTYTTKPPTRVDYRDYHFLSNDEFTRRLDDNEFVMIRTVRIPDQGEYIYKEHKYAVSKKDLEIGGCIILNWDGYTDLLSVKQDVVALLLEKDLDEFPRNKNTNKSEVEDVSALNLFNKFSFEENKILTDDTFIDKMAKEFRIYKIDASLPENELHNLVDLVIKEN